MHGESGDPTVWVNVSPGVAVEVRYDQYLYEAGAPDDEVRGELTGKVRMTREAVRGAIWGDSLADREGEGEQG